MTLEEKEAKKVELRNAIEEAETQEQLDEIKEEVEALNNAPIEEQPMVEEEKVEEKQEEVVEEKNDEVISKEEERSLIRNDEEVRNFKFLEERKMEEKIEIRNTKEYIDAYAEYIKSNDDKELRTLVTTNGYAGGDNNLVIQVPQLVYDIVKTAWEREDLMSRVRTLNNIKGNFKVQFEVSGSDAVAHTEGGGVVTEEELILGVVTLTPISIKKWVSISDEAVDLRGEDFLRYIYDELTYKIAKKCADELVGKITELPTTLTADQSGSYVQVSADKIELEPSLSAIAQAISHLSDEARDYTIVMNKLTYATFKQAQYNGSYNVDPFEGIDVVFNNTLPSYEDAGDGEVYCIVGDFYNGALAIYPNGEDIDIKYDDTTLMTSDLVRILGRRFVGLGAVADKSFVNLAKPNEEG